MQDDQHVEQQGQDDPHRLGQDDIPVDLSWGQTHRGRGFVPAFVDCLDAGAEDLGDAADGAHRRRHRCIASRCGGGRTQPTDLLSLVVRGAGDRAGALGLRGFDYP